MITAEDMASALAKRMNAARLGAIATLAPNAVADKVDQMLRHQNSVSLTELIAAFEADLQDPRFAHALDMIEAALTHLRSLRLAPTDAQSSETPPAT